MRSSDTTAKAKDHVPGAVSERPKCGACATGRLTPQEAKTALWLQERLFVVEGVPALVCDNCGEQFFADETAMRLDLMRGVGFPAGSAVREMRVPVFRFGGAKVRA